MERLNKRENENKTIRTSMISGEDLFQRISNGENRVQDKRFLPIDKGGSFEFFNPDILENDQMFRNERKFAIVEEENMIVALSKIINNPRRKDSLMVTFISVDPLFRDKGYGSKLVKEIFNYAQSNNKTLEFSGYTEIGNLKIMPVVKRCSLETLVSVVDRG